MTDAHSIPHLLLVLAALLVTSKLLGALARRVGQPAVLGELLAGVLLGASVFGLLDRTDPVIQALSELGVIVLLFEIGLHTDMRSMVSVLGTAAAVALVGVGLPTVLGYAAVVGVLGLENIPALVCAAALTATSIGISARVLTDIGQLKSREGQVVLGSRQDFPLSSMRMCPAPLRCGEHESPRASQTARRPSEKRINWRQSSGPANNRE